MLKIQKTILNVSTYKKYFQSVIHYIRKYFQSFVICFNDFCEAISYSSQRMSCRYTIGCIDLCCLIQLHCFYITLAKLCCILKTYCYRMKFTNMIIVYKVRTMICFVLHYEYILNIVVNSYFISLYQYNQHAVTYTK